ncbi:MAG: hypothetical protein ACI4P4_13695 [Faecousia sp.]
MRRTNTCLLALFMTAILFLCGCGKEKANTPETTTTLWVVTEESTTDGMNLQAQIIAERMEEAYDGLTVRLEILPTDAQEREVALKQLRTKIMAGSGPDVYLLPTGDTLSLTMDNSKYTRDHRLIAQVPIEPLFQDVTQAMRSGLFADIQSDYETDQSLGKEALKTEIMDAGVISGKRYILPLRFDIPVILTDSALWADYGLSRDILDSDAVTLTETLLAQERGFEATPGLRLPSDLSLLPRPFDYETEEVLLSAQEIAAYMHLYQSWAAVSASACRDFLKAWEETRFSNIWAWSQVVLPDYSQQKMREEFPFFDDLSSFNKAWRYIAVGFHWETAGLPLFTSRLADALESAAISRQAGYELTMLPLRTADGSVTATVTYFGAVGSSCETPELAYEFLRQFLTEEFQWDIYRPRADKSSSSRGNVQTDGQVEASWPVRTAGSVPYLWNNLKHQCSGTYNPFQDGSSVVCRQFLSVELTDADLPALAWPIDEVRFPVTLDGEDSFEYALSMLNEEDGTPTDVDIDALAEEVRLNLWWHLAEG